MEAIHTADETRDQQRTTTADPLDGLVIDVKTGEEEPEIGTDPAEDAPNLFSGSDAGDIGGDGDGGEGDLFSERGRPKNRAVSPHIHFVPFATYPLTADLFWLAHAYWRAHDDGGETADEKQKTVDLMALTTEEQGERIARYLKIAALEHMLADDDREAAGEPRQYAQEMHFLPLVRELMQKEMQAETERISGDVRRTIAEKLRRNGHDTLTLDEAVDLVLMGGESVG